MNGDEKKKDRWQSNQFSHHRTERPVTNRRSPLLSDHGSTLTLSMPDTYMPGPPHLGRLVAHRLRSMCSYSPPPISADTGTDHFLNHTHLIIISLVRSAPKNPFTSFINNIVFSFENKIPDGRTDRQRGWFVPHPKRLGVRVQSNSQLPLPPPKRVVWYALLNRRVQAESQRCPIFRTPFINHTIIIAAAENLLPINHSFQSHTCRRKVDIDTFLLFISNIHG